MQPDGAAPRDDRLTIISIAILAYILQDLVHEGLGHGVTAWLSGAHKITMSTVALQSDIETRWIQANGTLANLAAAAVFWFLLAKPHRFRTETRYFFVMAMANGLFTGTGYLLFSGVANFGDWAGVIAGLAPYSLWRVGLILVGAASYHGSMLIVARALKPFQGHKDRGRRPMVLCWTPYFADATLSAIAGVLNPAGLFYVIASALPSTSGAKAGLIGLPFMMRDRRWIAEQIEARLGRRPAWIVTASIAALVFILVLGRGITWTR